MDATGEIELLTAAFLATLLGRPVHTTSAERIGVGYGLDGVLARVRCDGESLVAKWTDAVGGAHEARFLREVAPRCGLATPRLLAFHADPVRERALLLLEDIAPALQGDVLLGLARGQADQLVRAEARMHATFWDRLDEPALDWLPAWDDDMANRPDRTAECLPRFLASYADRIAAPARVLAQKAPALLVEAHAALRRAPQTLVHADLHAENVLFRPDGTPVILDWADGARGPAALDVARLLVEALTIDGRRAQGDGLVRLHAQQLEEHGVTGYGEDALRGDMRQVFVVLFAWSIRWAGSDKAADPEVPRVARIVENLVLNSASALVEG